jgi:hypothetical protein
VSGSREGSRYDETARRAWAYKLGGSAVRCGRCSAPTCDWQEAVELGVREELERIHAGDGEQGRPIVRNKAHNAYQLCMRYPPVTGEQAQADGWPSQSRRSILKRSPGPIACLPADGSVDRFAKVVSMAGMTGGFLDVQQHPPEGEVSPVVTRLHRLLVEARRVGYDLSAAITSFPGMFFDARPLLSQY